MVYYELAILAALVGFSTYLLIAKKYLTSSGVLFLTSLFILATFVGAFAVAVSFFNWSILGSQTMFTLVLLGALNTLATYLLFHAVYRGKAGIVNTVISSQDILIALFSSLLFVPAVLYKTIGVSFVLLVGFVALTINFDSISRSIRLSRYVIMAFISSLGWAVMWLVFYTLPNANSYSLTYVSLILLFSAIVALLFSMFRMGGPKKMIKKIKTVGAKSYLFLAGILNGVATGGVAYAYIANPVLTPILVSITTPVFVVLAFAVLKERFKRVELLGIGLIIAAVLLFEFI